MPCRKNASEVVSDDNEIQDIDSTIGVEVGIYAITAGMSKNISVYATFLKSKDSPCFFALSDDVSRIIAAVVASTPLDISAHKYNSSFEELGDIS